MQKAAEYEVIHGRWAMLAIPGIVAQEQATGVPWYETGALCTPSSCLENYYFPGAIAPLAPEGSGLPSFWAVLAFEVIFVGLAEAYRGGLTAPPKGFPSPADVGVYPGGRFDPFKFSEKVDMEEMKIKELKHCRRHGRVPRMPRAAGVHRRRTRREPHRASLRPVPQLLWLPDRSLEHVNTRRECGCGV